jgi:hypothetical protein
MYIGRHGLKITDITSDICTFRETPAGYQFVSGQRASQSGGHGLPSHAGVPGEEWAVLVTEPIRICRRSGDHQSLRLPRSPGRTTLSAALGICPPQPPSDDQHVTERDRVPGCGARRIRRSARQAGADGAVRDRYRSGRSGRPQSSWCAGFRPGWMPAVDVIA